MANAHDLLRFRDHCNRADTAQRANPGRLRPLYPEDIFLLRDLSWHSDTDIQAMYKNSRLTINTESVRACIAFLSRVWNAVENDGGSQTDRKYQEAYILATRMIPGRAAVGSFDPTALMPSHEEVSPPPLTLGADSSSDYTWESNQPNTPADDECYPNVIDSDSTSYYTYESSRTNTPTGQQPDLDDEVISILGGSNLGVFTFDQGNADLQMGLGSFMFPDSAIGAPLPQPLPSEVEYPSHPVPATLDPTGGGSQKRKSDDIEDISRNVKKTRKEDGKDLVDDAAQ